MNLLAALAISLSVAGSGAALGALTRGGAAVATVMGTAILAQTGWPGAAALAAFFAGGSLISRLAPDPGGPLLDAKGSRRDPWQVLANGGPAVLGAAVDWFHRGAGIWLVTASLAAAAADTWATACGGWSRRPPRQILSGQPVPPGTSGGVTPLGTLGALAGGLSVAGAAVLGGAPPLLGLGAALIGFAGMLVDSLLGATVQAQFECSRCHRPTERAIHCCGTRATVTRGWPWLGNDAVNACANGFAALLGWLAWHWTGGLT